MVTRKIRLRTFTAGLVIAIPWILNLGGCAQLRNELVTDVETVVRSSLDDAVTNLFEQLRTDTN